MRKIFYTTTIIAAFLSIGASARPLDHVRNPRHAGNGCPVGSFSVSESPDGEAVSVLFDRFVATAGGTQSPKITRMYCDFSLPFDVPAGYRLELVQIDFRGFNNLPKKSHAALSVNYGIVRRGNAPEFRQVFRANKEAILGDYTVTDQLGPRALRSTDCGEHTELTGRVLLMVEANGVRNEEEAMSTVDTLDGSARAGLVYRVRYRPCR